MKDNKEPDPDKNKTFLKQQIENFTRARTPEEYQEMKLEDLKEMGL